MVTKEEIKSEIEKVPEERLPGVVGQRPDRPGPGQRVAEPGPPPREDRGVEQLRVEVVLEVRDQDHLPGRPLGRSFRVKLWPNLVFLRDGKVLKQVARPDVEQVREGLEAIAGAT